MPVILVVGPTATQDSPFLRHRHFWLLLEWLAAAWNNRRH